MSLQPKPRYEFGPFRLDVAERLLLCDGETIPLQPKAFICSSSWSNTTDICWKKTNC